MKRTEIYLTEEQRKILKALGKKTQRSMASHIREAIENYIEELKEKHENR